MSPFFKIILSCEHIRLEQSIRVGQIIFINPISMSYDRVIMTCLWFFIIITSVKFYNKRTTIPADQKEELIEEL